MLTVLSAISLAQMTVPAIEMVDATWINLAQRKVVQSQEEVRPLPGSLDQIPVFNSNSPEVVQTDGILLSTFPDKKMASESAHLDYAFEGRFDLFAHHLARGLTPGDDRTLYIGILLHNPKKRPVKLDLLQAVSYLSQEAPFRQLPDYVANPLGKTYSGPGSRVTNDVLRGQRQSHWPAQIEIPPRSSRMLLNAPIPLRRLKVPVNGTLPSGSLLLPSAQVLQDKNKSEKSSKNKPIPINARSTLMHLSSDGPLYIASLAMYAPVTSSGEERVPALEEWVDLLRNGDLAGPRDLPPTSPKERDFERFFYGRVAGVTQGSKWAAQLTDPSGSDAESVEQFTIPEAGERLSYVLSTVDYNTFGTQQIQSAPMLRRYSDTAYRGHGNYGVEYDLTIPLYNPTDETQAVSISLQTPLQDEALTSALRFREPPSSKIFFRGTVRIRYNSDFGIPLTRYLHLIQRQGQQGKPLVTLRMKPRQRRLFQVQLLYPPDATPPQVLTVETLLKDALSYQALDSIGPN
ncbi:MAG: DUF3370 domain-containing protein [Cyanobacteria bacterium P01_F01_bin.42]